jgi:ribosomal protein S27AE
MNPKQKWYQKNKRKSAQRDRNNRNSRRYRIFNAIALDGRIACVRCGYIGMALQFDHKKDDGATDRKRFNNTNSFVKYYNAHLDEAMERLQILCANCNWEKKYQNDSNILEGIKVT